MIRIVVFIQCDLCNDFLSQIATTGDPRENQANSQQESLLAEFHDLRLAAEEHGWDASDDSTVHHCPSCCGR